MKFQIVRGNLILLFSKLISPLNEPFICGKLQSSLLLVIEGSSNLFLHFIWHTSSSPLELSYEIHLETVDHILRNPHVILKFCPFIYLQLKPTKC